MVTTSYTSTPKARVARRAQASFKIEVELGRSGKVEMHCMCTKAF